MLVRRAFRSLFVATAALLLGGCNEKAVSPPAADAAPPSGGLSQEQAARTLAKVGDRVISLGDFAATLERMDQFDRLRYQTKERRRELLDEIIDVELLAAEARRRGLDKQPETQEAIRQIMREAILADARRGLPSPGEIPADEVRAFYDANAEMFSEPERRRVAAIVLSDRKTAERVLEEARKIKTPIEWGELFFKHSVTAPKKTKAPAGPLDLAGDLGVVGAPDDKRGKNPKIPEPIRAAVFKIGSVGSVFEEIVEADGRFYIVRMNGITAAHSRTLAEADRSIRLQLLQKKMKERESTLEAELRKKFPVEIDDAALGKVKLPEGVKPFEPGEPSPWALPGYTPPGQEAADGGAGDGG